MLLLATQQWPIVHEKFNCHGTTDGIVHQAGYDGRCDVSALLDIRMQHPHQQLPKMSLVVAASHRADDFSGPVNAAQEENVDK